jgi:hypothetical protein
LIIGGLLVYSLIGKKEEEMNKLQKNVMSVFFCLVFALMAFCPAHAYEYILKAEYSVEPIVDTRDSNHIGNLKINLYVENYSDTDVSFPSDSGNIYLVSAGYASPSSPPHRYTLTSSRLNLPNIQPHSKSWIAFKDFNIISYDPGVVVIPIIKAEPVLNGSTGLVSGNQYFSYITVSDMSCKDLISIPKFDKTSDVENNSLLRNVNNKLDKVIKLLQGLLSGMRRLN